MGDAALQRRGRIEIAEDGRPLTERRFCNDDDAGAFIRLADEVEQQLPSRACERPISKFVERDQSSRDSCAVGAPPLPIRVPSSRPAAKLEEGAAPHLHPGKSARDAAELAEQIARSASYDSGS